MSAQVRDKTMAYQMSKQMWLRMSSAVCASAAWQTSSMHPVRIRHRFLRSARQIVLQHGKTPESSSTSMCHLIIKPAN